MQWTLALAVLATIVLAESAPETAVGGASYRLIAVMAGVAVVSLFATAAAGVTAAGLRRDFDRRRQLLMRFSRLRTVHGMLWLGIALATEYYLSWSRVVRADWGLGDIVLVDELLILAPLLLPLFLSWAAFYEVDRAIRLARTAATGESTPLWTRGGYLLFQARHQLGLLMVPLLIFLTLHDTVRVLEPDLLDKPLGAALFGLPIAALFLLFPLLLRTVWQTEPLPAGPLRERLTALALANGFLPTEILLWRTEGTVANAAVTGIWRRLRYVFLSDRLLAHFNDDELVAVFGHELGHVRYRHLLMRGLIVLAPVAVWWSVEYWLPGMAQAIAGVPATLGVDDSLAGGFTAIVLLGGILAVLLGSYSQRLEHEADLYAVEVSGGPAAWCNRHGEPSLAVHPFVTALEKLAYLNGTSRSSRSWQHASIARRIEFLERAAAEPRFAARFHARLRTAAIVLLATVLCGLLSQALAAATAAGII
ncbi:MAG: M48 family metalloprotease [Pirellulales bacterium]|nr:M48 family metalloprotease [Pirellulales bacterium]